MTCNLQQVERRDLSTLVHASVHAAEQKSSFLKTYTTYNISVYDFGKKFEISKRYDDFHQLHETLVSKNISGMPSFPAKQLLGSMDPKVIEARKTGLDSFVSWIFSSPAILCDEALKVGAFFDLPVECTKIVGFLSGVVTCEGVSSLVERGHSTASHRMCDMTHEGPRKFLAALVSGVESDLGSSNSNHAVTRLELSKQILSHSGKDGCAVFCESEGISVLLSALSDASTFDIARKTFSALIGLTGQGFEVHFFDYVSKFGVTKLCQIGAADSTVAKGLPLFSEVLLKIVWSGFSDRLMETSGIGAILRMLGSHLVAESVVCRLVALLCVSLLLSSRREQSMADRQLDARCLRELDRCVDDYWMNVSAAMGQSIGAQMAQLAPLLRTPVMLKRLARMYTSGISEVSCFSGMMINGCDLAVNIVASHPTVFIALCRSVSSHSSGTPSALLAFSILCRLRAQGMLYPRRVSKTRLSAPQNSFYSDQSNPNQFSDDDVTLEDIAEALNMAQGKLAECAVCDAARRSACLVKTIDSLSRSAAEVDPRNHSTVGTIPDMKALQSALSAFEVASKDLSSSVSEVHEKLSRAASGVKQMHVKPWVGVPSMASLTQTLKLQGLRQMVHDESLTLESKLKTADEKGAGVMTYVESCNKKLAEKRSELDASDSRATALTHQVASGNGSQETNSELRQIAEKKLSIRSEMEQLEGELRVAVAELGEIREVQKKLREELASASERFKTYSNQLSAQEESNLKELTLSVSAQQENVAASDSFLRELVAGEASLKSAGEAHDSFLKSKAELRAEVQKFVVSLSEFASSLDV